MLKKLQHYTILLTLGFFLLPSLNYACGTKSEKACCKKEISLKSEKKTCCKNAASANSDKCCEGKCGMENCGCASTGTTSSSSIFIQFKFHTIFNFAMRKKVNFYYATPSLSAGHSSIWLIPKIS